MVVLGFVRLTAAALGVAGWLTYIYFWTVVRIEGSMRFHFSDISSLHWFESWIEPFMLGGFLLLAIWLMFDRMKNVVTKECKECCTSRHAQDAKGT